MTDQATNTSEQFSDKRIAHNRKVQITGSFFSKMADTLANTKIVLPALFNAIAAPTVFVGLIAPIRESFSMLPQVAIKSWVANSAHAHRIYMIGGTFQAVALCCMLLSFLSLDGWYGGLAILGALLAMSLARSLCSLSSKTVLGATVPKSKRGSLMGAAGTFAGGISIVLGGALTYYAYTKNATETASHDAKSGDTSSISSLLSQDLSANTWILASLLAVAALCFLIAALSYLAIKWAKSENSETSSERNHSKTKANADKNQNEKPHSAWQLIRTDRVFLRFVVTRAFMMVSALAMPYVASLSLSSAESALMTFGVLIILEGGSALLSSRLWGNASDKNSRAVLIGTALASALLCGACAAQLRLAEETSSWFWLAIYAALSTIHQGVRLGRKTYIVDLADGTTDSHHKRTEYVAVSNTAIGVLLLIFGLSSAVMANTSLVGMFSIFALCAVVATIMSVRLKSV